MARLFESDMKAPATLEALRVRHALLERLSRIQRSISHGAPLDEVFAAIAAGAAELLGDPVAGLRLVDEHDPTTMLLVASTGLTREQLNAVHRGSVGHGAGGRAILEGAVVVIEDYTETPDGIARFGTFGVRSALAAPVRVDGVVVGSLTVASFEAGRRYDLVEQEILSALAEHAELALLDASLIDQRERRVAQQGDERFQALVGHSSDLIAIVDENGSIGFATPSVGRALGLPPEALVGSTLLTFVHPADRPRAAALLRDATTRPGTMPPSDWRLIPSGGQFQPRDWMHVEVLATNLTEHPSVKGIVINARNVTERVLAEDRLRHAQELEMLGRLAGHVAHDFNQVLAIILGYADLLRKRASDERTREDLGRITEAAEHGAALSRQLVTFSRRDEGEPEVLDLAEVTRSTARLVASTAPESIRVRACADEPLLVSIDPTKLRQVLMNLLDNAIDALPAGGSVTLAARQIVLARSHEGASGDLPPGRYAELSVTDDGTGMPTGVMARALEPAFTTKPSGSGTGLGLAIVHGVVLGAGGRIELRPAAGGGTVVEILLPLAATATTLSAPGDPTVPAAGTSDADGQAERPPEAASTILLVEDDASVLALTRRVLIEQGYAVISAPDAERALAAAREHEVDLLLSDQMMPGILGIELARLVRELRPGARAIIMSGHVAESAAATPDGVEWLQKPFGAAALLGSVRDALSRS